MRRAVLMTLVTLFATGRTVCATQYQSKKELLEFAETVFRYGLEEHRQSEKARLYFQIAAQSYEKLRRHGVEKVSVYQNAGNAYLLADQLPQAILSYRLGLERFGYDRQLHENLDYARGLVQYPVDQRGRPSSEWPAWLPRLTPGQLGTVAVVFYVLGCVCMTRWLMRRRGSWLVGAGACGLLAVAFGGLWGLDHWQRAQAADQPLVVIAAESVPLQTGNGPSYPAHAKLPTVYRGMEATLVAERGGWLQVQFPGGDVGWLPMGAAVVDE